MTPELIGTLSVGAALMVGLGGPTLALWRDVGRHIERLDQRLSADIGDLRGDVRDLDRRLARVEGVIAGLAYANGRDRGEGRAA